MNNETGAVNGDMNIRRFFAENSRDALKQVKATLGVDAIILINRNLDGGGVEILAAAPEAVDALAREVTAATPVPLPIATPTELGLLGSPDTAPAPATSAVARKRLASLFSWRTEAEATTPTFSEQTSAIRPSATPEIATAKAIDAYVSFADELAAVSRGNEDFVTRLAPEAVALSRPNAVESPPPPATPAPAFVAAPEPVAVPPQVPTGEPTKPRRRATKPVAVASTAAPISAADLSTVIAREIHREVGDVTRDVTREIRAMQATLTEQLSTLTWSDAMRRRPAHTKLMQDLLVAGFSPSLARHVQERLPDDYGNDEAHAWVESILRRNLPVANDAEELIDEGGVFALVGPTGVGKTTTVAKLAARFAMKHGVDQITLITTDSFRIGAQDQLRIYGMMLGVAVHSIHDETSLTSAIGHLSNKKLVLIDTAGLGPRDEHVAEHIAMLRGAKAKRLVVLNATVDAETLDHVIATFADRDMGCIITKTDEAARLGPVLDAVIRHRLRIHYVSTGQKVPEDVQRPDAATLVSRALERPWVRSALHLRADDQPVWMPAMAERAQALTLNFGSAEQDGGAGRV